MFLDNLPYTDYHRLNLDWVLEQVKKLIESNKSLEEAVKDIQGQVDEEVRKIIQEMYEDGRLAQIVADYIAEVDQRLDKIEKCMVFAEEDLDTPAKTYMLMNDITVSRAREIKGGTTIDLNGFTLKVSDDFAGDAIFTVNDNYKTDDISAKYLKNGQIDCNKKPISVILDNGISWRTNLTDLYIYDCVKGLFSYGENPGGAENLINNVYIYHSDTADGYPALLVKFGDSCISNFFAIGFKIGIQVDVGSNNTFTACHPWGYPKTESNQYSDNLIMNKGFVILRASNRFINCIADTCEPINTAEDCSYSNGGMGFYISAQQITLDNCFVIVHSNSTYTKHVGYFYDDINPTTGLANYLRYNSIINCRISLANNVPVKTASALVNPKPNKLEIIDCVFGGGSERTTSLVGDTEIRLNESYKVPEKGCIGTYKQNGFPTFIYAGDTVNQSYRPKPYHVFNNSSVSQMTNAIKQVATNIEGSGATFPLLAEVNGEFYIYSYATKTIKKITTTDI